MPPSWFDSSHSFSEKNRTYCQHAIQLCQKALHKLFSHSGIAASEIGHIFFVSTTGLSTPSIDAHLYNLFDFRPDLRRTPIWGLGCAGGVAGLSRAFDWLRAYPQSAAVVVSVELCGLTFIRDDLSKSNFVATALFADGCGAALLLGDRHPLQSARSLLWQDSDCVTWRDSLNVMGWKVADEGLRVIFSKSIPQIVQNSARPSIESFLRRNGLQTTDIAHFLSHPGGAKVVEAYRRALELTDGQLDHMAGVLRDYGNMSRATVFFVLERFLDSPSYRSGKWILSTALGPGFTSEMLLLRCL